MSKQTIDIKPTEEKLKDPQFKYHYDLALDTYEKVKSYLIEDDDIIKLFLYSRINVLLEDDEDKAWDLSYYKYLVANFIVSKDENKELVDKLVMQIKEDITNEKLNIILYQYFFMQYTEAMDLLKMVVKYFYLIDKYKGTPFSTKLLKYLNTINHYENYKPNLITKEEIEALSDKDEKDKAYQRLTIYYTIQLDYLRILKTLQGYLKGQPYNKDTLAKEVEEHLIDHLGLWPYGIYIKASNLEGKDMLNPIKNYLKNMISESKGYYDTNDSLQGFLEDLAKEHNIDIVLSEEEQKIIDDKIDNAISVLDNYTFRSYKYITFNTLTYLLAFNDDTKEWLKDANEDLTLEGYIEEKEEVKDHISEDKPPKKQRQDLPVKDKKKTTKKVKKRLDDNIGDYFNNITSRPYKLIDNARGTLTTYEETNEQTIKIELKKLREELNNTTDKKIAKQLKEEIKEKEQELNKAKEQKEKAIKDKKNAEEYLQALYNDIKDIDDKKSVRYKQLKKIIKEQQEKVKQYNKIIGSNGVFWHLDMDGNGTVILDDKNNKITLSISDISKEMAKYTREAQDLALYINALYLQDTTNPHIRFSIKNYINKSNRQWNTRYKKQAYNSVRLLARERWTIYEEKVKGFHLTEIPLYGKLEIDENDKDGIIELDITNDHIELMKNNGVLEYNKIDSRVFTLNNDNEYYAKKLFIYINYLDRIEKSKDGVISKTMKSYIKELQHYGIKNYVLLDGDNYFKREIYDKITQAFGILEDKGAIKIDEKALSQITDFLDKNKGKKTEALIESFENIKLPLTLLWRNYDYINEIATNTKRKSSKKKKTTNKN